MIEHMSAVDSLREILSVDGLDAILIGPYDLSASMGLTAQFDHPDFCKAMESIRSFADEMSIPVGVHVVEPSQAQFQKRLDEGYRFIAYSIDAVFLTTQSSVPELG